MARSARLDLHVHSRHSYDGKGSILDLARAAQACGLTGFALTDHDTTAGFPEIRDAAEATGMVIVPGIEVTTTEGHLLALGVHEPIGKGLSLAEAARATADQGGVAVPSHPLRLLTGIGPTDLAQHVMARRIGVAEAVNARDRATIQANTVRLCETLGLATTGGTDAHWIDDIGTAWTEFDKPVRSVNDAIKQLRKGRCRGRGAPLQRSRVWKHGLALPFKAVRKGRDGPE